VVQTNLHSGGIMHITGGKLRRRSVTIVDQKNIRPTSAKVREAIFSMIGQNLEGVSFLDCFGGSGIMGMEAWSRGADPVRITEKSPRTVAQIQKQLKQFRADVSIQCVDAIKGMNGDWDVVFLDPPYRFDIHPYLEKALTISKWVVIAETEISSPPKQAELFDCMSAGNWEVWKQKHYGTSMITIFRKYTSSSDSV